METVSAFVRGINQSLVESPHKGQVIFYFYFLPLLAQTNRWTDPLVAVDLKRHPAVMCATLLIPGRHHGYRWRFSESGRLPPVASGSVCIHLYGCLHSSGYDGDEYCLHWWALQTLNIKRQATVHLAGKLPPLKYEEWRKDLCVYTSQPYIPSSKMI